MVRILPTFDYEQALWKQGFNFIAGVDEVGRGAWAGPVVASAVAFAPEFRIENLECRIDDSKRLTADQREIAAQWIKKNALAWSVGEVGVATINRIGIGKATAIAMRKAVLGCNQKLEVRRGNVDNEVRSEKGKSIIPLQNLHSNFPLPTSIGFLLVDAFYIPYVRGVRHNRQMPIIKGDQKSISIAAASIIAKVYRDSLMESLGKQFKFEKYGWGKNKGYGTREHQNEILRNGLTHLHRVQFVETWRTKQLA